MFLGKVLISGGGECLNDHYCLYVMITLGCFFPLSFVVYRHGFHYNSIIYLFCSLVSPLQEAIRTSQPVFLFYLVSYFMPGSNITKVEAYLYAMGVTLSSMLSIILHQLYFFHGHRTGMHIRIATTGCVYRKASVFEFMTISFYADDEFAVVTFLT